MAYRYMQRGVTDGTNNYIAQPKEGELPSYLEEAFKLLEFRFANFGSCPGPFSREGGALMKLPPSPPPACKPS